MVELNICDVPVSFPNTPYMSQMSMMTRIINSLNKRQNCLLELPTGSGKTISLLCSTIAWYRSNVYNGKLFSNLNDDDYKSQAPLKIYFGTRTHKQIGQAVRELNKSSYASIRMSILSGRKQTCVNSHVLYSKDVDQSCKDLCATQDGCFFKVRDIPLPDKTWDIESIKPELIEKKSCPYFQMKSWMTDAEIIFCPYNYLLNSSIRKARNISLKNAIIILDEAHNIEDICREGASVSISQSEIDKCRAQFFHIFQHPKVGYRYQALNTLLNSLDSLIEVLSSKLLFKDDDVLKKRWDSSDFILLMKKYELDFDKIVSYKNQLNDLIKHIQTVNTTSNNSLIIDSGVDFEKTDKSENETHVPYLSSSHTQLLETFLLIAKLMLGNVNDFSNDFNVVITQGEQFIPMKMKGVTVPGEGWLSPKKRKSLCLKEDFILNIWCMNPGIVFKHVSDQTYSVILTSGTLSPMISFEKELNCRFESILQAPHIVSIDQTFIASIGVGPSGTEMQAIYKNINTFAFQDELGRMLLGWCQIVPKGILCFLSSFSLMEMLIKRWTQTKLIFEIEKHKSIHKEPRNTMEMDKCMKKYYKDIEMGALLFAVFRGKASEGIDFADDAARLVVTVGIPYPSVTDPKILLKKNYNTVKNHEMKKNSGDPYLTGNDWYNIQAFRALNQALGRCIRHRSDWGAMIMIDVRFGGYNNTYVDGLCKWIKHRQRHYTNWNELQHNLHSFINKHLPLVLEDQGSS